MQLMHGYTLAWSAMSKFSWRLATPFSFKNQSKTNFRAREPDWWAEGRVHFVVLGSSDVPRARQPSALCTRHDVLCSIRKKIAPYSAGRVLQQYIYIHIVIAYIHIYVIYMYMLGIIYYIHIVIAPSDPRCLVCGDMFCFHCIETLDECPDSCWRGSVAEPDWWAERAAPNVGRRHARRHHSSRCRLQRRCNGPSRAWLVGRKWQRKLKPRLAIKDMTLPIVTQSTKSCLWSHYDHRESSSQAKANHSWS